ncbi:MAG: L-threonylcarbamoyladenylate synthase [Treponema sp.]|jgi:tRNA threonylcarbamoyl adenosine modification protein (Sua5/YciO/YrdC/YwlC family)|nr:L-threonylcarbamoyladenylate synthase [Treponema sp.]
MIEYVVSTNIDDRVLARAIRILNEGGLAALPTDASWVLACSLGSPQGIKKLKSLSGERDERRFTLLCSDISQFGELCSIDNSRFRLIRRLSPGPYVFILKTLLGTEKALDIRRREAGVRIPNHPVPLKLIETLGSPLYSITAKRSMTRNGERELAAAEGAELPPVPEEDLFEAGWELEDIEGLDIILDDSEERERVFSTVLDLSGDGLRLLRPGAGPWPV